MPTTEEEKTQQAFTRTVVDRVIAKGIHPARAEKAVESLRFLQLNTGKWVVWLFGNYGPLESWQDGATDVIVKDIQYLAPEAPKPVKTVAQIRKAEREERDERARSEKRDMVRGAF